MFIGRKEYLDSLGMLWNKTSASLVTCRGRRRIGKSILIEEFAVLVFAAATCCAKPSITPIPVMPLQEALERTADGKGDGVAYYALAIHQASGKEMKRDRDKANAFLMKAVEAGYGPALYAYASARETRLKEERKPQGDLWMELGATPWDLLKDSYQEESLVNEESASEMLGLYQRAADTGLASASNAVERLKEKIVRVRAQAAVAAKNEKLMAAAYEKMKEENPGQIVRLQSGGDYSAPPLLDFDKATALAEKGDADGYYMLALHYARGNVVQKDREKAAAFLKKAADGGNPAAMFLLGCVEAQDGPAVRRLTGLSFWEFVKLGPSAYNKDYSDEAFINRVTGIFAKAGELGVAEATNAIVRLRKRHDQALAERTKKEANAKHAAAIEALVPPEYPKFQPMPFAEAVEKAAKGDAEAYCSLAVHYARGDAVAQDRTKALSCLKKAAELDSAIALLLLGAVRSDDSKITEKVADVHPYALGYFWRSDSDGEKAENEAMSLYSRARDLGLPQATNALARLKGRIAKRKAEEVREKQNEALESAAGLDLPSDQSRYFPLLVAAGEIDVETVRQWEVLFKRREARLKAEGRIPDNDTEADWKKILARGTNILSRIDLKLFSPDALPGKVAELARGDGYDVAWETSSTNDAFKSWSAGSGRKVAAWFGLGVARFSDDGRLESITSHDHDPWVSRAKREIEAARSRQAAEVGLSVESCELLAGWIGWN